MSLVEGELEIDVLSPPMATISPRPAAASSKSSCARSVIAGPMRTKPHSFDPRPTNQLMAAHPLMLEFMFESYAAAWLKGHSPGLAPAIPYFRPISVCGNPPPENEQMTPRPRMIL